MNKIQDNMDSQKNFSFSAKAEKKIVCIMEKYPPERKASAVMPLLDLAQREAGGWLPVSALETVALNLTLYGLLVPSETKKTPNSPFGASTAV